MNFKALAAAMLATSLASPAFSQAGTIGSTKNTISIPLNAITCEVLSDSTVIRIDLGPKSNFYNSTALKHYAATLNRTSPTCPKIEEFVGKSENGRTKVKVKTTLSTYSSTTYADCDYSTIEEFVEITLASGKVLLSNQGYALDSNCSF